MAGGHSKDLPGNGPTPTEYVGPFQCWLKTTAMDKDARMWLVLLKQRQQRIAHFRDIGWLNEFRNGKKAITV